MDFFVVPILLPLYTLAYAYKIIPGIKPVLQREWRIFHSCKKFAFSRSYKDVQPNVNKNWTADMAAPVIVEATVKQTATVSSPP